jgi:hypothetical protein
MNSYMNAFVIAWAILASFVISLALYRKWVARSEDDLVHLHEYEAAKVSDQATMAHRLNLIDRLGEGLTVVALVFGLGLVAVYLYGGWVMTSKVEYLNALRVVVD